MSRIRPHSTWQVYGVGLGLSALATLLVVPLAGRIGPLAGVLFAVPVVASAWYGGFGPGAVAAVVSAAALAYFVLPSITRLDLPLPAAALQLAVFAVVMATLTAIAARRRQSEAQAGLQARRWQALAQFSQALAGAGPGLKAVLDSAGRELRAVLPDAHWVQLLSAEGEQLETRFVFHPDPTALARLQEALAAPVRATEAAGSPVLLSGESLLLAPAEAEQLRAGLRGRHAPALERFAGQSLLMLPLRSSSAEGGFRAAGLLALLRPPEHGTFAPDERAWLEVLADRTALALDAARRYEAEQQARQAAERAADQARQAAAQAQRVQAVSAALAAAHTAEQAARAVAQTVLPPLQAATGALALLAEDNGQLEVIATGAQAGVVRLPLNSPGPLAEAARTGQALWLTDAAAVRVRYATAPDEMAQGWRGGAAALPLRLEGTVIGSLALEWPGPAPLDESARAFLQAAADQCAHALQRVRLYWTEVASRQAAEDAAAQTGRLQAASAALAQTLTMDGALNEMLAHCLAATGADIAGASLVNEAGTHLVLARALGYPELAVHELRELRLDAPTPEAAALRSGEPLTLLARQAAPPRHPALARAYASLRCEALAVLPLQTSQGTLGALTLGFGRAREFAQADRDFLAALAAQCSQALQRARLFETERRAHDEAARRAEQASFLAEASSALAESLDVQSTLERVAQLAVPRLADFCLAFVPGGGSAFSHREEAQLPQLAELNQRWLQEGANAGRTALLAQPDRLLVVPELSESMLGALAANPEVQRALRELKLRALIAAPLRGEAGPGGTLLLGYAAGGHALGADEQALAEALANRAGRALHHALRHAETQSLNAALEARVNKRTEELQATILKLEGEIAERERAQQALRESGEQLRSLSARLQATREEERARIAREVHDELGQQLTGLKMDIAWLRKKLREQQEPLLKKTRAMTELIDHTVQTVRKITQELRPGILDDFGLLAAIEWQVQEFQERTGLECQLISDVNPDEFRLPPEDATAVFRVFQETLTNVARHANATRVEVTLEMIDGALVMQVEDNGRGISERERSASGSLGLLGMRERIHLLNGELDIRGVPNEGTMVLVRVPLRKPSADGEAGEAGQPADGSSRAAEEGGSPGTDGTRKPNGSQRETPHVAAPGGDGAPPI